MKDAAGLIANKFLRFGIILLGFKLNLELLFTTGAKCLPLAALVVAVTVFVTYWICRWMGVDPLMAMPVSCGTGICGAAAVMGVSGSIKVSPKRESEKENDEVTAIAIVAIMGTIFALLEIAILPLLNLTQPGRASSQVVRSTKSPMPSQQVKASTVQSPPVRSMRPPWRTS